MLLTFLLLPLFTVSTPAATDWQGLLNQHGGSAVYFGAELGATPPYREREAESFAPASTAKLFTAGALLAAVGPGFRYPTVLRWTESAPGVASGVTLVGAGDPSWGLSELKEAPFDRLKGIASALHAAGIQEVQGKVLAVAADPRWSRVKIPEGWKPEDSTSCEGALAQAFNISLNCATFTVHSPSSGAWNSPGLAYPVHLEIESGRATSLSARFTGAGFVIAGTWKTGASARSFTLPVYDTLPWVSAQLRLALAAAGIRLTPTTELAAGGAAHELTFYSAPLSELLKPFLKNSINFMGDAFLKALAAQRGTLTDDSGLLEAGLDRLGGFLRGFGSSRDFTLHDGSGLSRSSRITPEFVFGYLERITTLSWFPALYHALPVAGVDGTLRNRMKGTAADGVLRAKTGTLEGVYNLAGFVPGRAGYVPFVLYTRTTGSLASAAKAAEDRVGAELASLYADPAAIADRPEPYPYVPEHAGMDAD